MGTVSITKGVAPLRKASTERGKLCIGKPLVGATIQYTPLPNAEGVETVEQLRAVEELGCSHAQGFYFSRAVPVKEIPEILGNAVPAD